MSDFQTQLDRAKRLHPGLRRNVEHERAFVDRWLRAWRGPGTPHVLDAGCGFRYGLITYYKDRVSSVGIDVDTSVIRSNEDVEDGAVADAAALPFASESFDLVFCRYVFEHLSDPAGSLAEFARVLRPGGGLILTTVSVENPGMWLARGVPMGLRAKVRGARFGPECAENAPTHDRANTPASIHRQMRAAGLRVELEEHFTTFLWYSRFSDPLSFGIAAINGAMDSLGLSRYFGGLVYGAKKES